MFVLTVFVSHTAVKLCVSMNFLPSFCVPTVPLHTSLCKKRMP